MSDLTNNPPPARDVLAEAAPGATDERFNWGLVVDVLDALEKHGYRKGDDQHVGQAIGILGDLVEAYEGTAP